MAAPAQADRIASGVRIHLAFFLLFALAVYASHLPYLGLPFHWDELGQFVPAALDLYREGAWVPRTTVPNVHPPGVMAYLAGVWALTGYSIPATRAAMLLLASAAVYVVFLLSIELLKGVRGAPAFTVVALLVASPIFYTQAMMAQLDMPAMLLTSAALLLFLRGRCPAAAVVSTVLVLVKETGLLAPALFGLFLWREGRRREAAWFAVPFAALGGWLLVLTVSTGHLLGNPEFVRYNVIYPLDPARFGLTIARRLYYLFVESFRWIGTLALLLARRRLPGLTTRPWRIAGAFAVLHVLLVSALGGAALERYLLPVLPLVYAAMAAALAAFAAPRRRLVMAALLAGLVVSSIWNPPYPFPYENNLAMTDFVRLHQAAAQFLERNYPGREVTTAWPLSAALRRPELGYVSRKFTVRTLPDFTASSLAKLDSRSVGLFVLYSREWEGGWNIARLPAVQALWKRFYGYEPPITPAELQGRLALTPVAKWRRRGLWIVILASRRSPVAPVVSAAAAPAPNPKTAPSNSPRAASGQGPLRKKTAVLLNSRGIAPARGRSVRG